MSNQNNICDVCRKNILIGGEKKCSQCREFAPQIRERLEKKHNNTNEKIKMCNSRTQCDPNKPGIKATLPENYPYMKCESCMKREK